MFFVCLAFIIIGVIIDYIYDKATSFYSETIEVIAFLFKIIGLIGLVISIIVSIYLNSGTAGKYQKKVEQYNYLMELINSDIYTDKTNKRFLIEYVYEWNKDIVYNKANQRDFILGPFIPNIYDNLQTIDYKLVFKENNNTYYDDFIRIKTILR